MRTYKLLKQSVVWMLILSMFFSLTACGKKQISEEESHEISDEEMVFSEEDIGIMNQLKGDINSLQVINDTVYVYCVEWNEAYYDESEDGLQPEPEELTEEDENEIFAEQVDIETVSGNKVVSVSENEIQKKQTKNDDEQENDLVVEDEDEFDSNSQQDNTIGTMNEYFYSFNVDGSNLKLLFSNSGMLDNNWLSYFAVSNIGYIYLLYDQYDIASESNIYRIRILDSNGQQQNLLDVTDIFEGEDTYISGILVDKKQQIYLIGEEYLYILGSEGQKKRAIKLDGWGHSLISSADGRILIETNLDDSKHMLLVYNSQNEGMEQPIELPERVTGLYSLFSAYADYLFYYMDDEGVWGYQEDTQKLIQVIDWNSSNVNTNYYSSMQSVSDGRFLANFNDYTDESATSKLVLFSKVDASQVKKKTTVVYGGVYLDETIRSKVIEYNKSQDKYQVVIKDYNMVSEDPVKAMREALISGNVPDIIDLSCVGADECIARGLLEDLYPFIDQDPELSRDVFLESILGSIETDGKLYHVSPFFGINVFVGRETDIQNKTHSFSISDLLELERSKEDASSFYMTSNMGVLDYFFNANYSHFVDWPKGECHFDEEEFLQILELANRYPNDDTFNWDDDMDHQSLMIQKGTLLFSQAYNMDMLEMEIYEDLFDQDVCFMGCPSAKNNAVSIHLNSDMGIYSKSQCKEGAWDFYRTMLMKDEMTELSLGNYYGGMPIRKDVFEDQIKRYSTTENYIDEYGNQIEPIKDFTWGYDDIELQIIPLNENEVETIRDLVDQADRVTYYNSEIGELIHEECKLFFAGNRTAEETAAVVQQKVTDYILQNR